MTKQELINKGAIYFDHIQQGFSNYSHEVIYMSEQEAFDYLKKLWIKNGPENSFVDFYYGDLEQESKDRVMEVLSPEEQNYVAAMSDGLFFPLDEMLLRIVTKLNDREMLFSTVYFTKEPCTAWGNFKQEYVIFKESVEDVKEKEQMKRPLQAVIFDMDGLMFDTERIVKRSWDAAGKDMGYGPMGDHIFKTLGMNLARRKEYFQSVYGADFPFEIFTEKYRAVSSYIMDMEGVPVKDGLYELLEYLKEKGYPMLVATSSSERHAKEKLEEAKVLDYFQGFISGDMVEFSKPHPQIFELACEMLQAEPAKCIVLEDSSNGLRAALEAGTMPIMIPDLIRDLPEIEPELEGKFESLRDVIGYLDEQFRLEK